MIEEMSVETFMYKIGGDCYEFAEKFQKIEDIFNVTSRQMKKELEIPTKQRRYILSKKRLI